MIPEYPSVISYLRIYKAQYMIAIQRWS